MQSSVSGITQATSALMSRQQAEQLPVNEAVAAGKAALPTAQSLTLPEDIVTLSSSSGGAPPAKKASKPVSNEERKALLHPQPSRNGFSVYG